MRRLVHSPIAARAFHSCHGREPIEASSRWTRFSSSRRPCPRRHLVVAPDNREPLCERKQNGPPLCPACRLDAGRATASAPFAPRGLSSAHNGACPHLTLPCSRYSLRLGPCSRPSLLATHPGFPPEPGPVRCPAKRPTLSLLRCRSASSLCARYIAQAPHAASPSTRTRRLAIGRGHLHQGPLQQVAKTLTVGQLSSRPGNDERQVLVTFGEKTGPSESDTRHIPARPRGHNSYEVGGPSPLTTQDGCPTSSFRKRRESRG